MMTTNLLHLHQWQPELFVQQSDATGIEFIWDFNRVRYRHFPRTNNIKQGSEILANRDSLAFAAMNTLKTDHRALSTRQGLFYRLKEYIRWCDTHYIEAFCKESVQNYCMHVYSQLLKGSIKKNTYRQIRSQLSRLCKLFDFPITWFDELPVVNADDSEPFEAYSQSDLRQLLPLLRSLFKQLSSQFLEAPEHHLNVHHNTAAMEFIWKGQHYPIRSGLTRLMSAATYLLAYYTFSNTSTLLQLKRPTLTSKPLGDIWYSMPAFKRRAFKVLSVDVGEHKLTIPKYCLDFFDTLLRVSQKIDSSPNALLFKIKINGKHRTINPSNFREFNVSFLGKLFDLKDERGRELRPVISRFRETGSLMTQIRFGEIAAAHLLDNTPKTVRRHYSTGNRHDNNSMMQETIAIRAHQAKHKVSVSEAKSTVMDRLNIQILTYDDWLKQTSPTSLSALGTYCKQPFGEKAKMFSRKSQKHQLSTGERLACADLLRCFGCEHQIIVQSPDDIWCLLSFQEALEESRYYHLDSHHFRKNFGEIIMFIDKLIKPRINRKILKQAEDRLNTEGRHPLWNDAACISLLQGANV